LVLNVIENIVFPAGIADDVAVYAAIAYLRRVAKLAKVTTKLCPL
jgi:hypothetical protein